jgi:hypothetical protein
MNTILLPSRLQCGFHHPELYIYDSSIITHKTHVMKGSGVIYASFTTGNPKIDEKLHPALRNARMRINVDHL